MDKSLLREWVLTINPLILMVVAILINGYIT